MRILKWVAGGAAVLAVLAALAWTFRFDLIILGARMRFPKIGPNQAVVWAQGPAAPAPAEGRPPNIVFILADDLGFNDITLNGGGIAGGAVPTPNIDSLAHDGVTFVNGYAGNATCAPSRAAIMTGRYATRFGFEFTPTPTAFSRVVGTFHSPGAAHENRFDAAAARWVPRDVDAMAMPASEITIAEMLRGRGYHTIHLGKWHLGGSEGSRPEQQGFDESLGFIAGGSMFLPKDDPGVVNSKQSFDPIDKFLWGALPYMVQYNGSKPFRPRGYMTDYLTDEAVTAIRANRNRPFFMYLAYNAPHTPLQATKADYDALPQIKDHRLRVYGAMVRNLDRNIGRVLAELKAQGLDDNTLVIFTSDNGGAHYVGLPDLNRPYRGWKATFFEGGVHVPFFMRWPAKLPAGGRFESPVAHVDIFATAAGAAGAALPNDRPIDGVDLAPYLTAGGAAGGLDRTLYWRSGRYKMVMSGGWKLQVAEEPKAVWLFDLKTDPTERRNLAKANPEKVRELTAALTRLDGQMVPPLWPSVLSGAIAIDHPLNVADKPGDEYVYWDN
ncbi:sulfatase-like hydrolase/transferase [Phenylobacterium sp.]|uniref:sulfatase-like hydrolase/transferase n=1 Tax=Phenylobacterium sp. TaxID=1871053 RepID=UPI00391989E2